MGVQGSMEEAFRQLKFLAVVMQESDYKDLGCNSGIVLSP